MLAAEILGKKFRSRGREHSVAVRYRCWVQDGLWSDRSLASPNFNSLVRAVRSFAIRYLNVVIKPLCGNLDTCLTTRLTPTFGRGILFACFSRGLRPKVKDAFFGSRFSVALLHNLAEKPEHGSSTVTDSDVLHMWLPYYIILFCNVQWSHLPVPDVKTIPYKLRLLQRPRPSTPASMGYTIV